MLLKLFPHGYGSAAGPINYLLNDRDSKGIPREPQPEVLRGDSNITRRLIDSLDFEYKYSSGVLSFAPEDQPKSEKLTELIENFEQYAFAGLDPNQYNSLWVMHRHTGDDRIELHFVFPRVELNTGKSLNAFPPGYQKYFEPWQESWNLSEGWASPLDPERARDLQPQYSAKLKHKKEEFTTSKQAIHDYLMDCIEAERAKDRGDLVTILKDELGLEINRLGKDYLSVRDPETDNKIRFKGFIYNESWRFDQTNTGKTRGTEEARKRETGRVLTDLESRIREKFTKRSQYNQSYYRVKDRDNDGQAYSDGEPIYSTKATTSEGEENTFDYPNSLNLTNSINDGSAFLATKSSDEDKPLDTIAFHIYSKIEGIPSDAGIRPHLLKCAGEIVRAVRSADEANSSRDRDFEEAKRTTEQTKQILADTSVELVNGTEQLEQIHRHLERLFQEIETDRKAIEKEKQKAKKPIQDLDDIVDGKDFQVLQAIRAQDDQTERKKRPQLER